MTPTTLAAPTTPTPPVVGVAHANRMRPALRFGLTAALVLLALSAFGPTLEVYVVLALLALLVLRELAGRALDERERARVDLLVALGFLAFLAVVVRRVVDILQRT